MTEELAPEDVLTQQTTAEEANVILRGGPAAEFPDHERIRYVPDPRSTLKLPRGNHYAHFAPTTETIPHGTHDLQVFLWTGTTYVAE
ncbi:DUF5988 family protein [Streptomyces zagrosensis]|uniref:Uncharacterized protein n=1 Tax=Streptomyces zagrosensis TaxID=1042984 RepID=A0A7W9QBN8_9ACTN|nr:DUF5988 family protein [Streptomyces zagrosensis]MBB5937283.1 hypothetical protein [Streptomyces zagrosensis]